MSRKTEKALNEKMNVKLPENLSKERLLEQLENVQQNEKIVEIPKKKNTVKRLVPIAASLALIVGLLSVYFGLGLGDKTNNPQYSSDNSFDSDKTEVVRYQSYDKIYDKFDTLRKEYIKNGFDDVIGSVFNEGFLYATEDDAVADDMAEDMIGGQAASSGSVRPESAPETENTNDTTNKNFGTTNRQEKDVDEGDIIKTDGNYLYVANADSKTVSIIDVKNGEMTEVSQIDVDHTKIVEELYINGDKMIVVGFVYPEGTEFETKDDGYVLVKTYGNNQYNTFVKVYDVTDRTAPKLVTEYTQQGNYDNSRMIGTKLYTISTYYVNIRDDDYRDKCIPETEVNGVCEKIPADCISVVQESNKSIYAVVTTLDIENGTEPTSEAILGNCNELYASAKGLFISETAYYSESYHAYQQTTKVYRFEYTDTGVNYKCMGKVAGYINDQFSMSYDGEYFRIATTVNKTVTYDENGNAVEVQLWDEDGWRNKELDNVAVSNVTMNNLYILNNNMQVVGKVEDLAQGETIKSVRFVGNMAYVVTFRQTDPLFVIDLSDPTKPTVKGELKIPGFSEYLHPIAEGLLVGVGQDGTEDGTNGDCKVSLFDVSNPYEPKESSIVRVSEGNAYCWTPVSNNHKLYITLANNEFAVPFTLNWYSNTGREAKSGDYYIRYRLTGDGLCEVARYEIGGNESRVMGATYIENIFYVLIESYGDGTYVAAFDLGTNEEIGRLSINARGG